MKQLPRLPTLLLAAITTTGCSSNKRQDPPLRAGESTSDHYATFGAAVSERLTAIERLPVKGATPSGGIPTDLTFLRPASATHGTANAVLLYDDELAGDATKHIVPIRTYGTYDDPQSAVSGCRHFLKRATTGSNAATTREPYSTEVKQCAVLKYAVVIRIDREVKPVYGAVDDKTQVRSFTPGEIDASLLVFELPAGKLVGGRKVEARNGTSFSPDKYNAYTVLETDLRQQVDASLRAQIASIPRLERN